MSKRMVYVSAAPDAPVAGVRRRARAALDSVRHAI